MRIVPAYESFVVEFVPQFSSNDINIKKTLVAFANTCGGDLYIGVNKDGSINGIQNAHYIEEHLWGMIRNDIFPSLLGFVTTEQITAGGKNVLLVHVDRGDQSPYALSLDDPGQIYVRLGRTSSSAKIDDIAQMIYRRNPTPFEKRISPVQDLTFVSLMKCCAEKNIEFDLKTHTNFGLWDPAKKMWTNLAYICSDQCDCQVVLLEFLDENKIKVGTAKKITGNVFDLLSQSTQFVERSNHLEISGGNFSDQPDKYRVKPNAVREAIVNQLVLRDYCSRAASSIHISATKLEFWSVVDSQALSSKNFLEKMVTDCPNPGLASLLARLKLIDGFGVSFRYISDAFSGIPMDRLVEMSDSSVKITLPRSRTTALPEMSNREKLILDLIETNGCVTRKELQAATGLSQTAAGLVLKKLATEEIITKEGDGPTTRYIKHH